ncbi:MAG: DUF3455 domain-containing protein, partial [Acetobacteraceae bacterium]|nr:DUF3455 domain-containing protein [Acetobacteraceae bacterium]
ATILAILAGPVAAEPVPAPDGTTRLLVLGADGVQIYACGPSKLGHAWLFQGPEALLFDAVGRQVGTHGAGPHWRLVDGSTTRGAVAVNAPAPRPGAIPWLLLRAAPEAAAGRLRDAAWIRRYDTEGGAAPAGGCEPGDAARMRYSARYTFYAAPR